LPALSKTASYVR